MKATFSIGRWGAAVAVLSLVVTGVALVRRPGKLSADVSESPASVYHCCLTQGTDCVIRASFELCYAEDPYSITEVAPGDPIDTCSAYCHTLGGTAASASMSSSSASSEGSSDSSESILISDSSSSDSSNDSSTRSDLTESSSSSDSSRTSEDTPVPTEDAPGVSDSPPGGSVISADDSGSSSSEDVSGGSATTEDNPGNSFLWSGGLEEASSSSDLSSAASGAGDSASSATDDSAGSSSASGAASSAGESSSASPSSAPAFHLKWDRGISHKEGEKSCTAFNPAVDSLHTVAVFYKPVFNEEECTSAGRNLEGLADCCVSAAQGCRPLTPYACAASDSDNDGVGDGTPFTFDSLGSRSICETFCK